MEELEANLAGPYATRPTSSAPPADVDRLGPQDGYVPAESARAYHRDLPDAELHLIDGAGHWLLETHFDEALHWSATSWRASMTDRRIVPASPRRLPAPAA